MYADLGFGAMHTAHRRIPERELYIIKELGLDTPDAFGTNYVYSELFSYFGNASGDEATPDETLPDGEYEDMLLGAVAYLEYLIDKYSDENILAPGNTYAYDDIDRVHCERDKASALLESESYTLEEIIEQTDILIDALSIFVTVEAPSEPPYSF